MKKMLLITIFIYSFNSVLAQAPNIVWDKTIGGSGYESFEEIQPTSDGGYILVGYSNSGADGDKSEASQGSGDYWVVKLDEFGAISWQNTIGGASGDDPYSVQQTSDGGYILGGSSTSGQSSVPDGDMTELSNGASDYWVVKLDEFGVIEWDKTIGGAFGDYLRSVQQTSDDGYILGGYSSSGISGDKSEASQGMDDYWAVKLDEFGAIEWDKTIGGSAQDICNSIQQTADDGGYVLGGSSHSGADGDKTEANRGGNDYWVVKLNASGAIEWDKTVGGSNGDEMYSIQHTSDDGYVLGGHSLSGADGDKTEASQGSADYWVVKLNASGTAISWQNTIGGSSLDEMFSIQQTIDGGYVLGGWSESGISGDKTEANGNEDFWVVKLDDTGTIVWDKTVGGSDWDELHSIQQTSNGQYVLGGFSDSGAGSLPDGDKTEANRGDLDFWVVILESDMPSGSGTSGDPYLITNLDDLLWLSETSSVWDKYFEQTALIDATPTSGWNSGAGFSPIGNWSTKFTGSYNGQGYTIDGLTINRSTSDIGLFGNADGATIQNLGLTDVVIIGDYNTGGLLGVGVATVINCYSTGGVSSSYGEVGGLIGYLKTGSTLSDCYSTVPVEASESSAYYIGGLVGEVHGSTVSNCYATGDVLAEGDASEAVGGLVGYTGTSSTFSNCYSTGDVSGGYAYVGGFAGESSVTISNCYSTGDVTSLSGSSGNSFGAFCGYSGSSSTFEYCYTTGKVFDDVDSDPTDKGFSGNTSAATFTNNFWSSEISNQTTAWGATNITTDQMKDHTTFTAAGWDFEAETANGTADHWDMDYSGGALKVRTLAKISAINNGYPYLSWEDGDDVSLPVELSSFIVEATNQGVLCEWTTESETENLGFILERKTEETNWIEIASYKTDDGLLGQGSISSATDYEYIDALVEPNTTYEYRLSDVDYDGVVTYHATRTVTVDKAPLPSVVEEFTVLPAYPNPFNPSTTITYGIDTDSKITVQIYDITGQLITTLLKTEQTQGWHSVIWNGTNNKGTQAPAGIYLSKITAGNEVKTNKLMLLK
jgi:hypothetical protein